MLGRASQVGSDLTDELELAYLSALEALALSSRVQGEERAALGSLSSEYKKYKEALDMALDNCE